MKITIQIIILLISFGLVDSYNRYFVVDEINGNDDENCLNIKIQPCYSIKYIYDNIVNVTEFSEIHIQIIGTYHLNETLNILTLKKVHITNHNNSKAYIVAGQPYACFVLGSHGISDSCRMIFSGITFKNFSYNNIAVITGWNGSLDIKNCSFIDNNCSAINILDSQVEIVDSIFMNNYGSAIHSKKEPSLNDPSFPDGLNSAGGAVAILFSDQNNISVMIKDNKFLNNHALTVTTKLVTEMRNASLVFSHIGGGLLIAFINKTMHNFILVRDNIFDSNKASIGGALMLSFHDFSISNIVHIINNKISKNRATSTGGGFAIATWRQSADNNIAFKDNLISENAAPVGGGGKMLLQSIIESNLTHNRRYFPSKQTIKFENTTFTKNKASSASGLHLIYNVALASKPLHPVKFINVTFSHHITNLHRDITSSPSAYSGIFLSNRIDVQFEGHNFFFNNNVESSIFLCNSDLFLHGHLHIHGNTVQTSGGGMALTDVSHIHLFSGSKLLFEFNFAQIQGGALYVRSIGFPDMVYMYNPSCFIQYGQYNELPPSKWNASVSFIGNGAGLKGSAIFTNTITSCTWNEHSPHDDITKALRWEGIFLYKENYIRGQSTMNSSLDIATDVVEYSIQMDEQVKEVAPGQDLMFHIDAYDELRNPVYSVPVAYIDSSESLANNTIELDQKYYIVHGHDADNMSLKYSATPNYYNQLQTGQALQQTIRFMDSTSNFPSNANITIKTVKCYPGFVYKDGYCKCDMSNREIIRCDDELVYIKENSWAMVGRNNKLIVKNCPNFFCQCNSNETKLGCAFNFKNPDLQCEKNRVGTLCGKCVNGTGLDFMTSQCVTCKHFPWSIVALALMGSAMLLISGLIIILNPQFSSYLKGILFYLQILPYVCSTRGNVNRYVLEIASWIDLGGFNNVPISSCFLQHFSSLHITSLGYLYPAVILLLLLIIYVLHKAHLMNLQRNSPFQSFWILVVIMYKFLVETSLLILSCVDIEGKYVFFYDGSITCYKSTHLILTGVAVGVLGFMVVPPPVLVPLIVSGVLPTGPFFADALSQGLRKHVRWWWSIDFLRRIAFIAIYVFISNYKIKQTSLMTCSILTLVLHAQMQPYRNRMANVGETFLLLSLTLITALPHAEEEHAVMRYIVGGIIIATFIYIIVVVLYLSIMFLIKRCTNRNYVEYKEESEDMYNETLSRRLKYAPQPLNSPKVRQESPILNSIMTNQSVPVPHYTRSDYMDSVET